MPGWRYVAALALLTLGLPAQDKAPKIDQKRVDEAVDRGCAYLLQNAAGPGSVGDADMLVLLTLLHGGASSERLNAYIQAAMTRELRRTYNVALMAMSLYELWKAEPKADVKEKYVKRMLQCAQWLVDNQTAHGQWRYGHPVPLPGDVEDKPDDTIGTEGANKPNEKNSGGTTTEKPSKKNGGTEVKIAMHKRAFGTDGDNSNSQYAALGLRACMDVGIQIPREVLDAAVKVLESTQAADGSWGYGTAGQGGEAGWGSMTVGAIGALSIYKYYLKQNVKQDKAITRGLQWVGDSFAVDRNPKNTTGEWHYYYLYGLERAGMLYGTEIVGKFEWYPVGADYLLKKQNADGSWKAGGGTSANAIWDTCFAVLFLRRATRPLKFETGR